MKINKVFLFLLIVFAQNYAQKNPDFNQLDQYITASIKNYPLPGLAIGIIKSDSIVFTKAYGVKNADTSEPLSLNSLFGIASLSKAFTAASIGMLVDEGLLKWDDRVIDHLPEFKLYDHYATREMRIRDLLCHRSGLTTFDGDLLWYGTNYSREEIIKRTAKISPKNSFRYTYGYSNNMFIAAGEVIKNVLGKSWDAFISEGIFNKLDMNNSTTTNSRFNSNTDVALPHLNNVVQPFINYDNSGPAASINSSVNDLIKWMNFWLNKGIVDDDTLLSSSSYYTIMSAHTSLNAGRGEEIGGRHFSAAALGWFLSDYAGRKIIAHGGGLPGYISRLTIVPEDQLGIVVLTNDESVLASAVTSKVLDMYFNDKDVDYAKEAYERSQKYRNSYWNHIDTLNQIINASLNLEDYSGVYEDEVYGKAEVTFENDKLIFSMLPTKELFTAELSHYNRDTFRFQFNDPFLPEGLLTFHFNSKGKIEKATVDIPNPDFHFNDLEFIKMD